MKSKVLLFAISVLLFDSITPLNAQDNSVKLENVINEQFGTLLESLLTDGKIDEYSAKIYLETVFGYDESVSSYLKTVNLSQISNFKQGNMSLDSYVMSLSNNLIDVLPENLKKSIGLDLGAYTLGQDLFREISSGKFGPTTISFIENIIEENAKHKALIEKIEKLTPTLEKLNKDGNFSAESKKHLVFDRFNRQEWNNITTKMANEYTTVHSYTVGDMLNIITVSDDYLEVFNNVKDKDATGIFQYYPLKTFKNKDRFDFSKDFRASFWIELNQNTKFSGLGIIIGKGYELDVHSGKNLGLLVATPKAYSLTTTYSDIKQKWPYARKTDKVSKKILDFSSVKVTIVKQGNSFRCLINDKEVSDITNIISYFPDKYFLGFKQAGSGNVKIHKIEFEHL